MVFCLDKFAGFGLLWNFKIIRLIWNFGFIWYYRGTCGFLSDQIRKTQTTNKRLTIDLVEKLHKRRGVYFIKTFSSNLLTVLKLVFINPVKRSLAWWRKGFLSFGEGARHRHPLSLL